MHHTKTTWAAPYNRGTVNRALLIGLAAATLAFAPAGHAQDAKAWLDSQSLEGAESKAFQEFEIVVARVPGAKDPAAAAERVVILRQGKPQWQSGPKDAEPGTHWVIHSVGRDLDGDGQPDVHFSGRLNGAVTHYVYRLKPQVRKIASYAAGQVGGGEFLDLPGRKAAAMISADDSSANVFAPYANSYFPLVVLEVSPKGRFQFANDLMQSRLPGQPPPVCTQPPATANPWLKERCAEFATSRRQARTTDIKARLAEIKSTRAADKLKWEDYYATGVLAAVSAEMNRYAYTGHGAAGYNWLETIWPGNDAIKLKFVSALRQSQAKSAFAEDLKGLASDYK
jgi:hypothetical protein